MQLAARPFDMTKFDSLSLQNITLVCTHGAKLGQLKIVVRCGHGFLTKSLLKVYQFQYICGMVLL